MQNKIDELRWHCYKVLPLVYDDSLSYYEVLCKVISKINEIINISNESVISVADPIQWSIENTYAKWTIVTDHGYAYISTKAVPSGVLLNNESYWNVIFNYQIGIDELREQIASANEGTSLTATNSRNVGDLVWLNGKLVKIIANMIAGDSYVEGSNYVDTTIENEIKVTYYPNQQLVELNAVIDGEYDHYVGDIHVFHPTTSTIEIVHN